METRRLSRRLAILAACAIALATSALAGCGGTTDGGTAPSSEPTSGGGGSAPSNSAGNGKNFSGSGGSESADRSGATSSGSSTGGSGAGYDDSGGGTDGGSTGAGSTSGGTTGSTDGGGTTSGSTGESDGAAEPGSSTGRSSGGSTSGPGGDDNPKSGQLTAGEWSDLEHWDFWLGLFDNPSDSQKTQRNFGQYEKYWSLHTRQRFAVRVVTSGDEPVANAEVELVDGQGQTLWSARTDNRGRADLYRSFGGQNTSGSVSIEVDSGGATKTLQNVQPISAGNDRKTVTLQQATSARKAVDIMLTVDTTGSMGDELSYIQSELANVINRTQSRVSQDLSIRTSVNLYRDEGDTYVVRSHPFRKNLSKAVGDVQSERAGGGGDYPEAVHTALSNAITQHQWRKNARAKLLFLVLDAPAHDKKQVKQTLRSAIELAAKKGIRIVPVAASGVDKRTEYLLRSMSIATGGTYTFLTDDSGIGGSHLEPTIGSYKVRYLNNLMVDVVARYSESIVRVSSK
jgi:hypothetical protein